MKLLDQLLDYTTPWTMPDVYLFTGNPVIKNNGAIVMGRGAAKQVRDTFPGIDKSFGALLTARPHLHLGWISLSQEQMIGWFKVKQHWAKPAHLTLISQSAAALGNLAQRKPHITFHMNYPGIGNGKLSITAVSELLKPLPDNVWIYR